MMPTSCEKASDPQHALCQVKPGHPRVLQRSKGSAGSTGSCPTPARGLQPTIYRYIYWRPQRLHHIIRMPGGGCKIAKRLEDAVRIACEAWECTADQLLKVDNRKVLKRPAGQHHGNQGQTGAGHNRFNEGCGWWVSSKCVVAFV